jgi:hypothetical protein
VVADTFAAAWDNGATVTPLGQLRFGEANLDPVALAEKLWERSRLIYGARVQRDLALSLSDGDGLGHLLALWSGLCQVSGCWVDFLAKSK